MQDAQDLHVFARILWTSGTVPHPLVERFALNFPEFNWVVEASVQFELTNEECCLLVLETHDNKHAVFWIRKIATTEQSQFPDDDEYGSAYRSDHMIIANTIDLALHLPQIEAIYFENTPSVPMPRSNNAPNWPFDEENDRVFDMPSDVWNDLSDAEKQRQIETLLGKGMSINAAAKTTKTGVGTVHRIKTAMAMAA